MRKGVVVALRARAAVEVLVRAGTSGSWAKRSGRGENVDLIVRTEAYGGDIVDDGDGESCEATNCGSNEWADDGIRKGGGRRPQLSGVLGGMVGVVVCRCMYFETRPR